MIFVDSNGLRLFFCGFSSISHGFLWMSMNVGLISKDFAGFWGILSVCYFYWIFVDFGGFSMDFGDFDDLGELYWISN